MVLLYCVKHALHLVNVLSKRHRNVSEFAYHKECRRRELMYYLIHIETSCCDIVRMGPATFIQLCHRLRGIGSVKDNLKSTVEEQVAKFLHILGQQFKN